MTNIKGWTGLRVYDELVRSAQDREEWRIMTVHLVEEDMMKMMNKGNCNQEDRQKSHSTHCAVSVGQGIGCRFTVNGENASPLLSMSSKFSPPIQPLDTDTHIR